ncbi:hypothetical protein K488DRAFT_53411 [Vararia minispora EC-137]|uniref:Uncharacterized protein n=1 Tax=Vararia minispora EC-137 TaxID=1314806 RepID=A0ACB8QG58_9AGAM|nr:hypothetical protein K488DRAFT_53411 [Vararia minispora EC-137]
MLIATPGVYLRRFQTSRPIRDPSSAPLAHQRLFAHGIAYVVDFWKRALLLGAIGVAATSVVAATSLVGMNLWIEYKELAPETDEECKKWEWDFDMERWTGGAKGGTDSGLGWRGCGSLRAAWIALNWGVGVPNDPATSLSSSSRFGHIERRLQAAHEFLAVSYTVALQKDVEGRLRQETPMEILVRLADVLERMGTKDALYEARSELEEVWAHITGDAQGASRLALKLGDINQRMGLTVDALEWWARSLDIACGRPGAQPPTPTIPKTAPPSPSAQRTLAQVFVSLSAFYAMTGKLRQAQQVEVAALELLRTIPSPASFASATPPQALHSLYLLHRSALLSVHLAEVSHGLRSPTGASIEWLIRAAESSERVARVLTGVQRSAGAKGAPAPSADKPLLSVFESSPSMKRPARGLLRDARRTATESWHLIGLLHEQNRAADAQETALACYERALGWAGVTPEKEAGEGGGLEAEWKALWGNYTRVREAIKAKAGKA